MGWERGEVAIELQQKDHRVFADFAFCEGRRGRGGGRDPGLAGLLDLVCRGYMRFGGVGRDSECEGRSTGLPPRWLIASPFGEVVVYPKRTSVTV